MLKHPSRDIPLTEQFILERVDPGSAHLRPDSHEQALNHLKSIFQVFRIVKVQNVQQIHKSIGYITQMTHDNLFLDDNSNIVVRGFFASSTTKRTPITIPLMTSSPGSVGFMQKQTKIKKVPVL
ncbi:hypothetical protein PAMP_011531 [Pampus punctatissimus]